jgi:MFS family permease
MNSSLENNIKKIAFIRGCRWFMLIMPVLVLFFQDNGLSMKEVLILQSVFSVLIVVCEVPSGYMADVLGRKLSIVLGSVLSSVGFCVYCFSSDFWFFLLAETLLGVSTSFISGADSALVYDTLVELDQTGTYKKVEGKLQFINNSSEAVAAVLGGFLAVISLRTPLYFEAVIMLLTIPVAFSLVEPPGEKLDTVEGKWKTLFNIVGYSLHKHVLLKYTIAFSLCAATATLSLVWFIQPYLRQMSFPLLWFGVVWAGLNLSVGLVALVAYKIEDAVGKRGVVLIITVLTPIGYILAAWLQNWFCLIPIWILYFTRGLRTPLFKNYMNQLTPSQQRATVLSIYSMMVRLFFAVLGPFLGWAADVYSISAAFYLSAVIFGVCLIIGRFFLLKYDDQALRSQA